MAATGRQPSFLCSLASGAVAGPCVDIALYPIDTIKTRIQAPSGFLKAGGFKGVYAGLGAGAIGSAPGSMFFFSTYEGVKKLMGPTCASTRPAAPGCPTVLRPALCSPAPAAAERFSAEHALTQLGCPAAARRQTAL